VTRQHATTSAQPCHQDHVVLGGRRRLEGVRGSGAARQQNLKSGDGRRAAEMPHPALPRLGGAAAAHPLALGDRSAPPRSQRPRQRCARREMWPSTTRTAASSGQRKRPTPATVRRLVLGGRCRPAGGLGPGQRRRRDTVADHQHGARWAAEKPCSPPPRVATPPPQDCEAECDEAARTAMWSATRLQAAADRSGGVCAGWRG
jgi:hypothetical protein